MNRFLQDAADLTVADMGLDTHSNLKEAARIIRTFLKNLQPTLSRWKPWMRYAVSAVIAILTDYIGDA